jgi:hypothetical protein
MATLTEEEIALQPIIPSTQPTNHIFKKRTTRNTTNLSSQHTPDDSENIPITYPEGGIAAWTVVLGSWCSMTAGLGIVNSTGVFQAYISNTILESTSENAVSWLFGIYVFLSYFCSVQIGPIFDARGPKELITIGGVFLLVGTFTLSLCTSKFSSLFVSVLFLCIYCLLIPNDSILSIPTCIFDPQWDWEFLPLHTCHGCDITLV